MVNPLSRLNVLEQGFRQIRSIFVEIGPKTRKSEPENNVIVCDS